MLARSFLTLYTIVAANCQDESTAGITQAKDAINSVIKDITREFDLPQQFLGRDGVALALTAGTGRKSFTLATDVKKLSKVWFEQNGIIETLDEIRSYVS